MTVKRIIAPSAREALRRVKEEMGLDAVVVSNRAVPGGVEITAMSADSLDAISATVTKSRTSAEPVRASIPAPDDVEDDYLVSLSSKRHSQVPFRVWQPAPAVKPADGEGKERLRPLPPRDAGTNDGATVSSDARRTWVGDRAGSTEKVSAPADPQVQRLMAEMQSIKNLLERQLAGFAWGEMSRESPARAMLLAELLDAGFSSALARRLIDEMPKSIMVAHDGRKWLASAMNRHLRTLAGDNDIIDQGGVFALVGPTGVGKTTTTAKLAARCVVRYGAEKLALLTTDGYRIGAHEQLRIYGRILGVPVHVVRDSEDLRRTLVELRDKHMVLIDTVGMSQRDRMVAEQAAMLMRAGEVKRLLLLNAGSRGDTLDDVIRAYSGEDLVGCILTKTDEAASLGPALDAVIRHGLLLAYIANGQRVPEDMHLPNRAYLLHRAFKLPGESSPHRLHGEDVGLLAGSSDTSVTMRGANFG